MAPYGHDDTGTIRADLRVGGFSDVVSKTADETSIAPTPRHPAVAYCQRTPVRDESEARDATLPEHGSDRAADAVARRIGVGPLSGKRRRQWLRHSLSPTRYFRSRFA
jgi:hypothetical protein